MKNNSIYSRKIKCQKDEDLGEVFITCAVGEESLFTVWREFQETKIIKSFEDYNSAVEFLNAYANGYEDGWKDA